MEVWIEINIFLADAEREAWFLRESFKPFVQSITDNDAVLHWHFFREPEIRTRFEVMPEHLERMESVVSEKLAELEKNRAISSYTLYGNHGKQDRMYVGEETVWEDMWPLAKQMYENLSNMALELLSTGADKGFFLHRYVHLFFDQLGFSQAQESAELASQSQQAMAAYIKEIQLGLVK